MTGSWILCVDDDEKVLDGLELQLSDHVVRTATGGEAGLDVLEKHPDCAVIISDMRMPGMNGAKFLTAAKAVTPDSTRVLLTGFSDVDSAIAAINEGGIYRFLTKPTRPEVLTRTVTDGIRQWELIQSERVLLEQTLHGAAQALIEALEIASPAAFSRSRRLESASRHVAEQLGLNPVWEVALAGLLVRLGWISLPPDIVDAKLGGAELSATDEDMINDAYATGVRLVGRIPRLDRVASIIAEAKHPSGKIDAPTVVRTVAEFDDLCRRGLGAARAVKQLVGTCPRDILIALNSWEGANEDAIQREVTVLGLRAGMVPQQDIVTTSGIVLLRSGTDITETTIETIRNFVLRQGIEEPISVSIPTS